MSSNLDPNEFALSLSRRVVDVKMKTLISSMTKKISDIDDNVWIKAGHNNSAKFITAKHLLEIWSMCHDIAKKTLKVTSQLRKHDGESTLLRNISTSDRLL